MVASRCHQLTDMYDIIYQVAANKKNNVTTLSDAEVWNWIIGTLQSTVVPIVIHVTIAVNTVFKWKPLWNCIRHVLEVMNLGDAFYHRLHIESIVAHWWLCMVQFLHGVIA